MLVIDKNNEEIKTIKRIKSVKRTFICFNYFLIE